MRKSDRLDFIIRKSDWVKVHHKKKSVGLRPHHERKSDGVRVHHEKVGWGETSR